MLQIVPINPYDKTGFLLPFVVQRILDFGRQHMDELDSEVFAKSILLNLTIGHQNAIVIALVNAKGDVVGHGVATIETDGKNRWVFVSQLRVDPSEGANDPTIVRRCIQLADDWGTSKGASNMVMTTPRSDEAWRKKYGFSTLRHLMIRKIGSPIGTPKEPAQERESA